MANIPIGFRVKLTYNEFEVNEMAEFCPDCWNEINGTNNPKEKYIISKNLDLCEGCGEMKLVIICANPLYSLHEFVRNLFSKNRSCRTFRCGSRCVYVALQHHTIAAVMIAIL